MRVCKICQAFDSPKWRADVCATCYSKNWRIKNQVKVSDYDKTLLRRFKEAARRAKERKLNWELSIEEFSFIIDKPCYYCDNKIGGPVNKGSGIDRIDNNLGYISNNILSCCESCNVIRSNILTVDEMREVAKLICNLRKL